MRGGGVVCSSRSRSGEAEEQAASSIRGRKTVLWSSVRVSTGFRPRISRRGSGYRNKYFVRSCRQGQGRMEVAWSSELAEGSAPRSAREKPVDGNQHRRARGRDRTRCGCAVGTRNFQKRRPKRMAGLMKRSADRRQIDDNVSSKASLQVPRESRWRSATSGAGGVCSLLTVPAASLTDHPPPSTRGGKFADPAL